MSKIINKISKKTKIMNLTLWQKILKSFYNRNKQKWIVSQRNFQRKFQIII